MEIFVVVFPKIFFLFKNFIHVYNKTQYPSLHFSSPYPFQHFPLAVFFGLFFVIISS